MHPLQNPTTIIQIYNWNHYTTLITEIEQYYYYGCLGLPIPHPMQSIHYHLRVWYGPTTQITALKTHHPKIDTPYTAPQQDGWTELRHAHDAYHPINCILGDNPNPTIQPTTC